MSEGAKLPRKGASALGKMPWRSLKFQKLNRFRMCDAAIVMNPTFNPWAADHK
jgi:hypothetical protein